METDLRLMLDMGIPYVSALCETESYSTTLRPCCGRWKGWTIPMRIDKYRDHTGH